MPEGNGVGVGGGSVSSHPINSFYKVSDDEVVAGRRSIMVMIMVNIYKALTMCQTQH